MEHSDEYPYADEGTAEEGADGTADGAEPGAWGRSGWAGAAGSGATRRGGGGGGGRKRREPNVWESREVEREIE